MKIKKNIFIPIFIILSILLLMPFIKVSATLTQELSESVEERGNAYLWAKGKGVTTMKDFNSARLGDGLTRGELAKMMSVYIEKMGIKTNYLNKNVYYKDVNSSLGDLEYYIKKAYQYQIMGIDANGNPLKYFNPYKKVTRAEFGTVFSRVLYGNMYNKDGNKYYENHLKALKNAGIMNKIDDPFQVEMRSYVMIMMMRTDKSFVPKKIFVPKEISDEELMEQINEILKEIEASNNETKQNENDNKKGTITISATSTSGKKVIAGTVSDLDTLTFRASDNLSIDKIVLERYGYSSQNDVNEIRLEDQDGNMVSNIAYGLQNDKATLTIKKDYKTIYGTEKWTIVLKLNNDATAGGTIGFKLSDMTSSAKTIDMDYYNANTYEIVNYYESNSIKLTNQLNTTHYTYDNSKTYKLVSFKIKSPNTTAVTINGFNLTNKGNLNINDILDEDKISLKVNDKTVKINSSIRNGKLIISLKDSTEISAKGYATFDLYGKLIDLTEFGKYIQLSISETSDVQVVEKKTGARVNVNMDGVTWPKIYFDEAKNSSDDNSSNDNSGNDSSSNDASSNDEDTSSDSSNSPTNCVDIEVDDGKSYSFCIRKWKDDGSKYSVSVDNAKDLSLCSVGRKGYGGSRVFIDCKGNITNWKSSGTYNLSLSISYNKKTYDKSVYYDLTNGVFTDKDGNPLDQNNSNASNDNSSSNDSNNSEDNNSDNDSEDNQPKELSVKSIGLFQNGGLTYQSSTNINLVSLNFNNLSDSDIQNVIITFKFTISDTLKNKYVKSVGIHGGTCNINKMINIDSVNNNEVEINLGGFSAKSNCLTYIGFGTNGEFREEYTSASISDIEVTSEDAEINYSESGEFHGQINHV